MCFLPFAVFSCNPEPPGEAVPNHPCEAGSATVLVGVARDGPLRGVAHAVPGVSRGRAGMLPLQGRLAARTAPVTTQFRLHLVEGAARIAVIGLHAGPVRGLVLVETDVLAGVRAARMVVAPVAVFHGGIRSLLAHHRAGNGT